VRLVTFLVFLLRTTAIVHLPFAVFALAISRKPWVDLALPVVAVCRMRVAPGGTAPMVLATPPRTVTEVRSAGTTGGAGGAGDGVAEGMGAGGVGAAAGVTALLSAEAAEVPVAFVAVTVNVYAVPLVSPVTVHEMAPVVVQVRPPGEAVTV